MYLPTFNCPWEVERIGRAGEGGKVKSYALLLHSCCSLRSSTLLLLRVCNGSTLVDCLESPHPAVQIASSIPSASCASPRGKPRYWTEPSVRSLCTTSRSTSMARSSKR